MTAGFKESRRNKEEEERSPVHLYFTPLGLSSIVFHRKDATKGGLFSGHPQNNNS